MNPSMNKTCAHVPSGLCDACVLKYTAELFAPYVPTLELAATLMRSDPSKSMRAALDEAQGQTRVAIPPDVDAWLMSLIALSLVPKDRRGLQ